MIHRLEGQLLPLLRKHIDYFADRRSACRPQD
jgi:hypothetical protein